MRSCNTIFWISFLGGGLAAAQTPCCIQPDINGPSRCTTVDWCNESWVNCEGHCEGTWTTLVGITEEPVSTPPPAVNPAPSAPIQSPSPVIASLDPCCIQPEINGPDQCTTVNWCNQAQNNCEGDCEGSWMTLEDSNPTTPPAASNPTEPAPTNPTTPPPVSNPTPDSTEEPCCIQPDINGPDLCTTVHWCNQVQDNCEGDCEGTWTTLGASNPTLSPVASNPTEPAPSPIPPPPVVNPTPVVDPGEDRATFFFGHSLIYHTFTDYSNTNVLGVPYWLNNFHSASGSTWLGDGEFRTNNYELPPGPNWWFQPDISAWQNSFSASGYDSIVYTELNYVQYKAPWEQYDYESAGGLSPVDSLLRIIDFINNPNVPIYIYECWNDGGSALPDNVIDATESDKEEYYASSDETSAYHQWWLDLYDRVTTERPNANVQLIPVGSILVEVLRSPTMASTSIADLFEDSAPHGRPTIYFLAGLILYMSVTGEPILNSYAPPNDETLLSEVIGSNFDDIVSFIESQVL